MPIKPPRLDDRSYDDLVREARALIPQYCPEWTHLGDSDPGMTLVQLFAWMTELTLYRLNRVPDKTYVHFLNFIGEDRRTAQPAWVPLTFTPRGNGASELPTRTRCSTRQRSGGEALHFLTRQPLTVHDAVIDRVVAVAAGEQPRVREIPFDRHGQVPQALLFDGGHGVQPFRLDPIDDGPHAWTPDQLVYVRHEELRRLATGEGPRGALRLRSVGDPGLPVAALFEWSFPDAEGTWRPVGEDLELAGQVMGLREVHLRAHLPGLGPLAGIGGEDAPLPLPDDVPADGWIRGRVRYERWLVQLMEDELRISWRDDRGGEERDVTTWYVRDVGRTLELFVQNLPPIRSGWSLRFTMVDHGLRAGRDGVFPRYRWSWRRGNRWIELPDERVEQSGSTFVLSGPFPDLASDGFNLRAERVETLDLEGLFPELQAELVWRRPVDVWLASGPEPDAAVAFEPLNLPQLPFQPAPTLAPLLGMKLFVGSDLLGNRRKSRVQLEFELGFERDGEPVDEPVGDYHLQLTYRSVHGWQVVGPSGGVDFARFTLADLDPEGAKRPGPRRVVLSLDPREQLSGLVRAEVAAQETCWLRLELTRSALTYRPKDDDRAVPVPVSVRLHDVQVFLEDAPGAGWWEESLPGVRLLGVEQRARNPRLTRVMERRDNRLVSTLPLDPQIDISDDQGGHHALYLRFDRRLPAGGRLATMFRCRGETWLPRDVQVQWELLRRAKSGDRQWIRLASTQDPGGAYALARTGELAFPLDDDAAPVDGGVWIRAVFRHDGVDRAPALPPLTHLLSNTVEAVNLHAFRMERFSGLGVPGQVLQLQHFPVWLPELSDGEPIAELHIDVEEEDGERRRWRPALGNTLTTASKEDRVFVIDPVEGTLTFGNGIRGRILPVGSFNVTVAAYHTVPGAAGNVAAGEVRVAEGFGDLVDVANVLPATGGRNAESIEEIIRRAPSVLTSRDRAVTRADFEVIATEASTEVARAACVGEVSEDGMIEVVVLPRRRDGQDLPDPFLSAGLRDHVAAWLGRRCLVNVRPRVRLATFLAVDVSIDVRLKAGVNRVQVREQVTAWVRRFLDPYQGGLDGEGWPFGGTLYAQDFGRLVTDLPDVRHVVGVSVHAVPEPDTHHAPSWESTPGVHVLPLLDADLPHPRHVRVRWVEELA